MIAPPLPDATQAGQISSTFQLLRWRLADTHSRKTRLITIARYFTSLHGTPDINCTRRALHWDTKIPAREITRYDPLETRETRPNWRDGQEGNPKIAWPTSDVSRDDAT